MIRISKSQPPNPLTEYASANPGASWSDFRNFNGSTDYRQIQTIVFDEQHQLCAYCEVNTTGNLGKKRIEHFVSKSLAIEYHNDWQNIFGVCFGGSDSNYDSKNERLSNLSCDSHKAHLEQTTKKHLRDWHGYILNPLTIPEQHQFFSFKKSTGELYANQQYCESVNIPINNHPSVLQLVEETINVLNLNCQRLCSARREILFEYERQKKAARENNDISRLERFALRWSSGNAKEFQTTRNILLRESEYLRILCNL